MLTCAEFEPKTFVYVCCHGYPRSIQIPVALSLLDLIPGCDVRANFPKFAACCLFVLKNIQTMGSFIFGKNPIVLLSNMQNNITG